MKRNLLFAYTLLFCLNYIAQDFPIQIMTVVPPPYPQTFEQALGLGNNSFIILNNTDLVNSQEIKLTAKISSNNGILVEVQPEATPSQSIILAPGETRTVFGQELEALYLNYTESDIVYSGIDLPQIINNPYMPEGTYTFCIKAFDYNTSVPLSNEFISGCAAPVYITTISPPIITYPFNEQEIEALTPQLVIFSWTPVSFNSPNVRYAFQMVDYTDLNVNVYDLLDESDFNYYSEENIIGNTLIYGPNLPTLELGHDYAVRVKAYLMGDELNIENDGFSDVVQFHYAPGNFNIIGPGFPNNDITDNPFTGNITIPDIGGFTGNNFTDYDLGSLLDIDLGGYGTIESTGETVDETPPQIPADLGCGAGCNAAAISDPIAAELEPNSMVNIGNFQMQVEFVNPNADGSYTGSGYVTLNQDFSPLPVKVAFTSLKVNAGGQIISGEAEAEIRTGSWLDGSWNNIEKKFDDDYFGSNPDDVYENMMSPAFRLDTWIDATQSAGITLPAGYGEGDYQVQITKMVFGPTQGLFDAMLMIPIPDDVNGTKHLIFAASDICISPSGPSIGNDPAKLSLSQTVRYKTSEDVSIEISAEGDANLGLGTFVELDCDGFYSASISGQVIFSPDFLTIESETGNLNENDSLSASFTTEFESWDSWIAELNFINQNTAVDGKRSSTRFQYEGLEGYTFKITEAKFDHDINANFSGMSFPHDYTGSTGQDWQGLFIKDMEVLFPKWAKDNSNDERMSITGEKLLIDGSGLSGQFEGTNLANLEDGSMGGWDFSVDSAYFKIVSNSFLGGDIVGQLNMPISDNPMNYSASIDYTQNQLQHNFVISTEEDIAMPAFLANLTLAPESSISVQINNDNVLVEANLNGEISLPGLVDEIPGCSFENITFQNMMIRNQGDVFQIGSFGTDDVSAEMSLAGLAVGLTGMAMNEIEPLKYELGLDLNMQLGTSNAEVSGGGRLNLLANRIQLSPENFEFNALIPNISSINVSGDLPGVKVNATVEYFDNQTLGTGFAGDFDASFLESVNVSATAIFGTKLDNGIRKKFFLVEGMGSVPAGIPFAGPVALYGLGGGLYYNMKPTENYEVKDITDESDAALSMNTISSRYTFEDGQLGLKAAVVVGLTPPDVFNADVALTIGINTNTFGISSMNLSGEGYMMTSISDRSDPLMDITVDIGYNFSTETLDGAMSMNLAVPSDDPLITAVGSLLIHASPQSWFFKVGTPAAPCVGEIKYGLQASLEAYFMTGMNLPSPIIPTYVKEKLPNYQPQLMGAAISNGVGVAMGVHAEVGQVIDLLVADMNISVDAGFDFTAMSYGNSLCNGTSEFGINKWYANVQGYIFGTIAFTTASYEWLSVYAGLVVEGALPNPSGFHGVAVFGVETWFEDFEVSESFSVGTICEMTPGPNTITQELNSTHLISELPIIDYVTPTNQSENVGLTDQLEVYFHIDPNVGIEYNFGDNNGELITQDITFNKEVIWQEKVNGTFIDINYEEIWHASEKKFTYRRLTASGNNPELLRPLTLHRFKISITPMLNHPSGAFFPFEGDAPNDTLMAVEEVYFTTEENVTTINTADIDFCKPYDRQRYVTPADYNLAQIKFNVSYLPSFQVYMEDGYVFHAKLYEPGSTQPAHSIPLTFEGEMKAEFDISGLDPEIVFKIVFTATKTTTQSSGDQDILIANNLSVNNDVSNFNPNDYNMTGGPSEINTSSIDIIEMYTYYFRTSKYASLQAKISSFAITNSYAVVKPTGLLNDLVVDPITGPMDYANYNQLNLILEGGEPFDTYDLYGHPFDPNGLTKEIIFFYYWDADTWYHGSGSALYCPNIQSNYTYNTDNGLLAGLQVYTYKSTITTGSSAFDFSVKTDGVSDPLSDTEVGLTTQTANGSGYSALFGGNASSYGEVINSKLHLRFDSEKSAKTYFQNCSGADLLNNPPYNVMETGNFDFRLITRDADDSDITPTRTTNLNTVNIQIP